MIYENLSFSCLCPGVPGVGRCGKPLGIYVKKANLTNDLGLLYVAAVFAVPATTLNPKAEKKEMLTVAIACEAVHPGTTQPAAPTLQNSKVTCGEGTRDLSFPNR